MYNLAFYGIDEADLQLAPNHIVDDGEYETILESAVTALGISDAVIDSISTGGLLRTHNPTGSEGPIETVQILDESFNLQFSHETGRRGIDVRLGSDARYAPSILHSGQKIYGAYQTFRRSVRTSTERLFHVMVTENNIL